MFDRYNHSANSALEQLTASIANWEGVLEDIPTLENEEWIGQNCMNWYILKHWLRRKQIRKVIYLNQKWVTRMQQDSPITDAERVAILRDSGLEDTGDIPRQPVAVFVHSEGNHWFVAAFDYDKYRINVYGRSGQKEGFSYQPEDSDTAGWRGDIAYRNIAQVFRLGEGFQEPTWHTLNWYQVRL